MKAQHDKIINHQVPPLLRGHVQTIIGKNNVIVTLGGRGVQGVTLKIAAEGKTVSKQGKFVSNHDVKSRGGGSELNVTMMLIFPVIVWTCPLTTSPRTRLLPYIL